MAKASAFRGIFGPLGRWVGGIPIDRSKRAQFVDQVAEAFASNKHFVIAITPEGTRSHVPDRRSGFYHIAMAAKVPIVMATIDYGSKLITYGASIMPTGDIDADMEKIRDFYQGVVGRHPERQGEIRLRPTDE